ncbi:NAD(P)/FAD-dependent oxidoreductase [Aminipila butyrica]|uniref:NAD(P)/FAD-dependent oxidoreductase n=1 Tax=Aminipila butyrica TaxID=433296 RepID=A0A858BZM1_9FIRM|nr:FAD-dependent oxidoreductase [Aminipila butyrica]QIB69546.1 NAD(P)/FAD-dependent oxidoreductase [Aminipila butyrica]
MRHVIIGVGAAGMTAARRIRELEPVAEIVMVSKDEHVHSRCMLHHYLSGHRDERTLNFVSEDFFVRNNITWLPSVAVQALVPERKNLILTNHQVICYDKLLIATGADSFMPPIGDFPTASNVFGLRNLSDAQAIGAYIRPQGKVVIVGSGLVGMDAAYALLERQMDVTVVEMAERILPLQLDEVAGQEYRKRFEQAGCKFLLGRKASETVTDGQNRVCQLVLDDGTTLNCNLVIVAAGVHPALGWGLGSGLEGERSISVNDCMETNLPDVYAAGDVTGLSGIWPNAMKQGRIAAENMCGFRMCYEDTYALKNTINFFGLVTLSLGKGQVQEGDQVVVSEDRHCYKRAIIRDHKLDSILLQGNIDYAGIYQYLIKKQIPLEQGQDIFKTSFADYYKVRLDGQYEYQL